MKGLAARARASGCMSETGLLWVCPGLGKGLERRESTASPGFRSPASRMEMAVMDVGGVGVAVDLGAVDVEVGVRPSR